MGEQVTLRNLGVLGCRICATPQVSMVFSFLPISAPVMAIHSNDMLQLVSFDFAVLDGDMMAPPEREPSRYLGRQVTLPFVRVWFHSHERKGGVLDHTHCQHLGIQSLFWDTLFRNPLHSSPAGKADRPPKCGHGPQMRFASQLQCCRHLAFVGPRRTGPSETIHCKSLAFFSTSVWIFT